MSTALPPAAGTALFVLTVGIVQAVPPAPPAPGRAAARPAQGPPGRGGRGEVKPPAPPDPKQLLEGTDEDETLKGGSGDDWLFGKKGHDWLNGGAGHDAIDGADGEDTIDGGAGNDIIDGGAGGDTVRAGDGDDTIDGGDEDDTLDAGAGNDDVDGGDGNDALRGAAGNDVLAGGDDNDSLDGGAGSDRLRGEDGMDTVIGGAGDDLLFGGNGSDTLHGGVGDDRVDGGEGDDLVRGDAGLDVLLGSSGQDTLQGGDGHDSLFGGDGDDLLNGGVGSDWILPGRGTDVVTAGDGDDLIVVRAGDVSPDDDELVNGGNGSDALILNGFGGPFAIAPSTRGTTAPAAELADPVTGGTYRISRVESVEFTQLLTSAGTADRAVSLLLVNPAAAAVNGRMLVYAPDGAVVPVAAGGAAPRDIVPFSIPALGSVRLGDIARGAATVQIFSASPVGAMLGGDGSGVQEAVLADAALVPVIEDASAGIGTGFVVTNSTTAANISVSLRRFDGDEIDGQTFSGAREVALAPYAQATVFIRDMFPTLGDFRGTVSIDGDISRPQEGGPVTIVALERAADGRVVTSPAAPLYPSVRSGRAFVQNVTAGSGSATSLVVMNAWANRRTLGTVRLFDEGGTPWLVSINGQPPAASVPIDLSGAGTVVLTLSGTGPAQRGSVHIETTQGAVGVTMRTMTGAAAARALPGRVGSRLIAAARRDRTGGVTTRIAIGSTGEGATVTLTLRAASGAATAGGTVDLPVPPNGQVVRALEELFPGAALDSFDGTLTIAASGGTVAATVSQVHASSGAVVALPVVAMP